MGWAGIGIDSTVDIANTFKKYKDGFIQGNFDEQLLLLPKEECRSHIEEFLNTMQSSRHYRMDLWTRTRYKQNYTRRKC